ncbi:MAG TPA: hypothetical protein VM802_28405 [Chitinophaga sp.]|uniref:hypothetical protein n=1 Tax=Chitinophaga sp. TaxID=1869181 RepID=UPI002C747791|nr:hypothetical protein [Chitinophaga sp.]HVI48825.1 hypothetical protein [Chitinophaga sp.]
MRKCLFTAAVCLCIIQAHAQTLNDVTTKGNTTQNRIVLGTVDDGVSKLQVSGGGITLTGSTNNVNDRPPVTNGTGAEIRASSLAGYAFDDGLLRLSAGGGTNANTKSYIDLSGYSSRDDMNMNIVFGTMGAERLRINPYGNTGLGTPYPFTRLTVSGGGVSLNGGLNNTDDRPVINNGIPGEIRGYSGANYLADDGFLRLSAGGGTNISTKSFIDLVGYSQKGDMNQNIVMGTAGAERIRITPAGNVGIGTPNPVARLSVKGDIYATKVKVTQSPADWPDFVFDPAYRLLSLQQVERFIKEHKHLPEIPSAQATAAEGLDLGRSQAQLLQKIEELTLYLIEQNKKMDAQQQLISRQQQRLEEQEKRLNVLEKK